VIGTLYSLVLGGRFYEANYTKIDRLPKFGLIVASLRDMMRGISFVCFGVQARTESIA